MSKRRRMFDIEMPEHGPGAGATPVRSEPEVPARRGPMATAITEAADSVRERRDLEARIRAENDALAHEHVRLKRLGLIMELLPLDAVDARKLARDRFRRPDEELPELTASIRAIGLSNPIRVERAGDNRWELIQGFRRLAAYRALLAETGDAERYGTIPAVVMEEGDTLESLYRRMVDENLVRKDISFAEMAQLALDYAADPTTGETDPDKAVVTLYQSAGYQKRSYIRAFIKLIERLGRDLQHAQEIPRALGLALVAELERDGAMEHAIRENLASSPDRTVQAELAILRRAVSAGQEQEPMEPRPANASRRKPGAGRAKTSFQIDRPEGRARCTAAAGRLEIRLDRDFSTIDRRKLEIAVRRMLEEL
jgi:ParB family transcriptional regulator, chromosome partitioning protein